MKKKNKKKKKLSSLILLLLFTVVLLGTSTYAWFTSNKNVSVEGIDVKVSTMSGLLISADAVNWKTTLTNTDLLGATWTGVKNQLPTTITNTSTGITMDADETGFLDMYDGEVKDNAGVLNLTTTKAAAEVNTASLDADKKDTGNYVAFDVFFKTETADAKVVTATNGAVGGTDKGLKNASRIAFVTEGSKDAAESVDTIRGLNGATPSNVVVWEPNYDTHTSYGVTQASSVYGISTLCAEGTDGCTGNAKVDYKGVKAAVTNHVLTASSTDTTNYSAVTTVGTLATPTTYTAIFTLPVGVTKMRIYYWIEGQDVDCENNASGSEIMLNIALSQNETA